MPGPRCLRRLAALALPLLVAGSAIVPVAAQEATPDAGQGRFPITPDPALCQVEPRDAEALLAVWYRSEGTPVPAASPVAVVVTDAAALTIPLGPRAEAATVAAVTETVVELFSCFAAGDFPRAAALLTDDVARAFGPEAGTPIEEARAFLEATPTAEGQGEVSRILAITDVMVLDDGRVGAIVVEVDAGQRDSSYVVFEPQGERLLVDAIINFAPDE